MQSNMDDAANTFKFLKSEGTYFPFPRSASAIGHTRPAKGRLASDCLRNTHYDRLTLSF